MASGAYYGFQKVPETLSDSILEKMHAPAKTDDPIITVDKLTEADGFMFGIPTRFGTMPGNPFTLCSVHKIDFIITIWL